jgi:hypothetical protein
MKTPTKPNVPRTLLALALVAIGLLSVGAVASSLGAPTKTNNVAFHDAMRKLWEDHITWTRLVIVSVINGLPDTPTTVARLLQNQVDIGNAIKPFYGDAAGNQLTSLLHDHITIAAEILTAAKAGENTALNDALSRWYANANQIAGFLHTANPKNWALDTMKQMMKTHLDLTLKEAVTYLKADYQGSVNAYEQVHLEILQMADMLSAGIIHQFHSMFENNDSNSESHMGG